MPLPVESTSPINHQHLNPPSGGTKLRQAGTWDPLLPCCNVLAPGQNFPRSTKYKETVKGLKITVYKLSWLKAQHSKAGLKLNFQKTKIMASGPLTSWQIEGETMETVTDFIFLGSKITADGDCSHEIKRCLLLGRKAMTNLDSIFKSRDITLPKKVRPVKAMVFPVVMYGCESWTMKKAER